MKKIVIVVIGLVFLGINFILFSCNDENIHVIEAETEILSDFQIKKLAQEHNQVLEFTYNYLASKDLS